ncbi:MAG: AbrB/MazE/SpoVT family DNA-binding domain-containing protein [Thermoanaerobaculia bacterium]
MATVTLGAKGQISIPKPALQRLGLSGGELLVVETTADGAIVLRPAAVYPIEIYSDERIAELSGEDEMPAATAAKVRKLLSKSAPPKRSNRSNRSNS